MQIIELDRAVQEICIADAHCRSTGKKFPYLYLVGAGISTPPIPLANAIIEHCKQKIVSYGRIVSAEVDQKADTATKYSTFFREAYPHAEMRRQYLESLIKDQWVSHANFRLAHLLQAGFGNIVVTPNFDDFLSRALTLFGEPHSVCDHPKTVGRIDPESKGVQIVHIHGSYHFYDACNLASEINDRAAVSLQHEPTMPALLDRLISNTSPLVIGYSGWSNDAIMQVLKGRIESGPFPHNLYWFCYTYPNEQDFPEWLRNSSTVVFVAPPRGGLKLGREDLHEENPIEGEAPRLEAASIFEGLLRENGFTQPSIVENPLAHFASLVKKLLPKEEGVKKSGLFDLYGLENMVNRIERSKYHDPEEALEKQLEVMREAIRVSNYAKVLELGEAIADETLPKEKLYFLIETIAFAGLMIDDADRKDRAADLGERFLNDLKPMLEGEEGAENAIKDFSLDLIAMRLMSSVRKGEYNTNLASQYWMLLNSPPPLPLTADKITALLACSTIFLNAPEIESALELLSALEAAMESDNENFGDDDYFHIQYLKAYGYYRKGVPEESLATLLPVLQSYLKLGNVEGSHRLINMALLSYEKLNQHQAAFDLIRDLERDWNDIALQLDLPIVGAKILLIIEGTQGSIIYIKEKIKLYDKRDDTLARSLVKKLKAELSMAIAASESKPNSATPPSA